MVDKCVIIALLLNVCRADIALIGLAVMVSISDVLGNQY